MWSTELYPFDRLEPSTTASRLRSFTTNAVTLEFDAHTGAPFT